MNAKTLKTLNKRWRGRSFRKGGERVAVLRDASAKRADRDE